MPNKVYSPELKIQVVKALRDEHISYKAAAEKYGISTNPDSGKNLIKNWEKIYIQEGEVGLFKNRRLGSRIKNKQENEVNIANEQYIAEIQRLRDEVLGLKNPEASMVRIDKKLYSEFFAGRTAEEENEIIESAMEAYKKKDKKTDVIAEIQMLIDENSTLKSINSRSLVVNENLYSDFFAGRTAEENNELIEVAMKAYADLINVNKSKTIQFFEENREINFVNLEKNEILKLRLLEFTCDIASFQSRGGIDIIKKNIICESSLLSDLQKICRSTTAVLLTQYLTLYGKKALKEISEISKLASMYLADYTDKWQNVSDYKLRRLENTFRIEHTEPYETNLNDITIDDVYIMTRMVFFQNTLKQLFYFEIGKILELYRLGKGVIQINKCAKCGRFYLVNDHSNKTYCDYPSPINSIYNCDSKTLIRHYDDSETETGIRVRKQHLQNCWHLTVSRHPENERYAQLFNYFRHKNLDYKNAIERGSKTEEDYLAFLKAFPSPKEDRESGETYVFDSSFVYDATVQKRRGRKKKNEVSETSVEIKKRRQHIYSNWYAKMLRKPQDKTAVYIFEQFKKQDNRMKLDVNKGLCSEEKYLDFLILYPTPKEYKQDPEAFAKLIGDAQPKRRGRKKKTDSIPHDEFWESVGIGKDVDLSNVPEDEFE
jgi:transposase-like protein